MAQLSFNATQVAPQQSFQLLPAGWYVVQITESEIKPTKNGTGQMLNLKLQVLDGDCKNRIIFGRLNIVNQNKTAEDIGQSQLSAICHAVGVLNLQDTAQLHNKPLRVKVKIRKDDTGQYEDQNEVSGFEAVKGAVPSAAAPGAAAPASPAANTPPWAKRA